MNHVRRASAQHQRGEGATHSRELGVTATLGIDPAVEGVEHTRRRVSHLHRFGQVAKSVEKTAHCGLGCNTSTLGTANSIGDRGHYVPARLWKLGAENGAGEILIAFARAGIGEEPGARSYP